MKAWRCAILLFSLIFIPITLCAAGGQEEAAAGTGLGEALAEAGRIIPENEIRINSYIARIDYDYPRPKGDLSVTFISGGSHIPGELSPLLFQAGIQGREQPFEHLPPFNIVFLVDTSGSMASADKLPLALIGVGRTIDRLRPGDRIGVVVTSPAPRVLQESSLLRSERVKTIMKSRLRSIKASGTSSRMESLSLAFREVEKYQNPEGINRVILISDGLFDGEDSIPIADSYKEKGINLTTIGFGLDFNSALMIELSKKGGGSSRFVSDDEDIEETFFEEFDRMTVPVARDLNMMFRMHLDTEGLQTWGYRNQIDGSVITYNLPTLHHRDYETILVEALVIPPQREGRHKAAEFSLVYTDLSGKRIELEPQEIFLEYDKQIPSPELHADPYVLKSSSMLALARNLIDISRLYETAQMRQVHMNIQGNLNFSVQGIEKFVPPGIDPGNSESKEMMRLNYEHALDLVLTSMRTLEDTEKRLDMELYPDEKKILFHYVNTIGKVLNYSQAEIETYQSGAILRVPVKRDTLSAELEALIETLFPVIPENASLLFPGVISESEASSPDISTIVGEAAADRHIDLRAPLPGTEIGEYRDTSSAIMAGKATNSEYVAVIINIRAGERTILYGKILRVRDGEVIRTSQRVFSEDG